MAKMDNSEIETSDAQEPILEEIGKLNISSAEIIEKDVSKINHKTIRDRFDEYLDGAEITSRLRRIVSVAGIAGTLGASLAGCKSNPDVYMQENVSTKVPMVETITVPKETKTPTVIVPFSDSKETVYKDMDLNEVERWKELTPEKMEKVEKIIQTTEETEIILIPVRQDYFYNHKENPTIWKLPAGLNLEIKDIYYFKGEDDKLVRFSILPNVMASKSVPIVFLDNGHMENENYVVDGRNYEEQKSAKILSSFSYLVGENEVYPNKTINILTAMKGIAERQEKDGKFLKGQEYSYLDLINLENLSKFEDGFTSSRAIVKGGGVCAGATLLSNSLYELGLEENVSWNSIVKEKWLHPSMYFLGPFSVNDFVTDATVQLSNTPGERDYDFKWVQPKDAYIKIDIAMIPNGLEAQDTDASVIDEPSDVEFMLTLSFTEIDPGNQSQKIEDFISAYREYRSSGHTEVSKFLNLGKYEKEINWDNPTYQVLMDYIYPDERVEHFQEEIEKEEYLSQIRELRDVVNALPTSFSGNLGDYLKTTEWYEGIPDKESVEAPLRMLNYTKIEGQPLQCVGFVILLAGLKYEGINFQNVGGAYSFGNGTTPAETATELIPFELISDEYAHIVPTGYGGIALGSKDMSIDDYEVGDLFVRTDVGPLYTSGSSTGANTTFKTGHIGAIIGKKVVDEEVVLLVADANRKNDGKIRIFEVTEHNFYKIFGEPGIKKFIIRATPRE